MVTQIGRQRLDSPERWQKALQRALDNGIELFTASDDGERFATSASHLDQLHRVDAYRCTCEAAVSGDPVCQHRAVVRFTLGWVMLKDRSPETAATVDCGVCHGRGWLYYEVDGGRSFPGKELCRRCGGCGQMPVRIVRTLNRPAVLTAD